jgi:hypothetical protein
VPVPAPSFTKSSRGPRVKKLQKAIKENLKHRGFDQWADGIIVDGVPGPMTFKMARLNGSMRGLSKQQLRKIARGTLTRHAELILLGEKKRSRAMRKREKKRAHRFKRILHELNNPPRGDGIVTFDGKPCAKEIAFWLQKARDNGWGGELVSGVRSPEHSEDLCFGMCGAPSCPGTCAGRSSNHCCPPSFKCKEGEGAADCSDYLNLAVILRRIGAPIFNALPQDRVHFSYTGA